MIHKISDFLRLIRFPNLVIIFGIQYLLRYGIISPILKINSFSLQLPSFDFFLLVLSTMSMAGAAYVINDYFDQKTDRLNHPEDVLLEEHFSRRQSLAIHIGLNGLSVLLGLYLSWKWHIPILGVAYLLMPGLLFFYSNSYKRQFLIGNLMVALLVAMIPMLVALFELPLLNRSYLSGIPGDQFNFNPVFYWIAGFSTFTFGMVLMYEWLKDLRDVEGDREYQIRSVPVVLGPSATRLLIAVFGIGLMGLAIFILLRFLPDRLSMLYFILTVFLPFLLFLWKLLYSSTREDLLLPLLLLKIIMLAGLLYIVPAHYIITSSFGLPFPCL
jgi:4-hydroxybenzoate polyprenyltransferase